MQKIDFVYVNYNAYDDLKNSLAGLESICSGSSIDANVIIVDNSFCSSDSESISGLIEYCNKHEAPYFKATYIPSDGNLGFGKACNKGAMLGTASCIVFVNCDTDFSKTDPEAFGRYLSLSLCSNVAIAGPKVLTEDGFLHASCFSFDPVSIILKPLRHARKVNSRALGMIPRYRSIKTRIDRITYEGLDKTRPCAVDWVSGCFMLIRRDAFRILGGFDPNYFLYFEDVDICRKARQLGMKVLFDPTVSVIHIGQYGSSQKKGAIRSALSNQLARYHLSSWFRYMVKWRKDFISKFLLVIGWGHNQNGGRRTQKIKSGYRLDFSVYDEVNKSS